MPAILRPALPPQVKPDSADKQRNHKTKKIKLSPVDKFWTLLFALAFSDVLISYLGNSLQLPLLPQPWRLIIIPFSLIILTSLHDIVKIKTWLLLCFSGLLLFLLLGYFIIEVPTQTLTSNNVPFKILPTDLLTMAIAFLIGSIWVMRKNVSAKLVTDVFLALATIHAVVCIFALLKLAPSVFPLIDAVYYSKGAPVSRPEITTDQTRQILYLFVCLCVVFTQKSLTRVTLALITTLMVIYIITKVQSRWSTVVFILFILIAYLMALYYRTLSMRSLLAGIAVGALVILWNIEEIVAFTGSLLWRFQQIDSSYGGRMESILYLLEKLGDPAYWIPHGYNEFFQLYGSAPHSFPTMVYLNAGLPGLLFYLIFILTPLAILLNKVIRGTANKLERTGFFCGSFTFFLSITQPVINHEIFWLMAGVTAGVLSRNYVETRQRETKTAPLSPKHSSPRIIHKVPG